MFYFLYLKPALIQVYEEKEIKFELKEKIKKLEYICKFIAGPIDPLFHSYRLDFRRAAISTTAHKIQNGLTVIKEKNDCSFPGEETNNLFVY